jgi:SAM-dependent methyltransferase
MFDPQATADYFDEYGLREWNRLTDTPLGEISLHLHTHMLRGWVRPGMRVLEIGAGAGRFTQVLAELGARVVAADISPGQLALNRGFACQLGFAAAVEEWQQADICDLAPWPAQVFDCVVAYGGPFSYVLDRRDDALRACLRVLRPGGLLLGSVMSLWGSARHALAGVLDLPPEWNQQVTALGDLTPETFPGRSGSFMHLFRAGELREWLRRFDLPALAFSASGVLAGALQTPDAVAQLAAIRANPTQWAELLRMELEASAEPGCLDMGTHLIFVTRKEG